MWLSDQEKAELSEGVERQWLHPMLSRRSFPNKFFRQIRYRSRIFDRRHIVYPAVEWLARRSASFEVGTYGWTAATH